MHVTHQGVVLFDDGEYNGRDDSDFYATVWNAEKGTTERVTFASTRGWTYRNGATADATPEVLAAYEAFVVATRKLMAQQAAAAEAAVPRKGRTVVVARGRKVPKGTTGTVVWYGAGKQYGYYSGASMRVGVKDAAGRVHFTDAKNVDVIAQMEAAA